ncbi:hypothetical protein JVU11DRAFT_10597 [Chiua virens]|nr:hypothetical protein JVU11DRAFT_10597 [Chiua virens]
MAEVHHKLHAGPASDQEPEGPKFSFFMLKDKGKTPVQDGMSFKSSAACSSPISSTKMASVLSKKDMLLMSIDEPTKETEELQDSLAVQSALRINFALWKQEFNNQREECLLKQATAKADF